MSVDVLREVFHHSRSRGVERNVLNALADAAGSDGVCWLPIVPSSGRKTDDPRCITHRANCSKRSAIRAIDSLVQLGELEVRKAQRGRVRISVYRVLVGAIAGVEVEYERLPFTLDRPFGRGDKLAPRQAHPPRVDGVPDQASTGCHLDPPRGANHDTDEVPSGHQRARVNGAFGAEPSVEPSREPSVEPSAAEERVHFVLPSEQGDREPAAAGEGVASLEEVVAFVGRLAKADLGTLRQIEPYARQLPRERYRRAAEKLVERRSRGSVDNDAGLFLHLLKVEWKEFVKEVAAQRAQPAPVLFSPIERLKREQPRRYLRLMIRPRNGLPPLEPEAVDRYLEKYVAEEDERDELRAFAEALRSHEEDEAAA